jgi:hypothetical protein
MRSAILLLILSISFALNLYLQEKRPQTPLTESVSFSFNEGFPAFTANSLRLMSFGYENFVGGLLWLRFLQNLPVKKIDSNSVSWVYLDLNAISDIDPGFYPVFTHGAPFLSVIIDDKKGAELLLLKGTQLFPSLWKIHAYLGYHYQFELHEPEKAQLQYEAGAALPGASPLMGILAASLKTKQQSKSAREASIRFLENLKKSATNEAVIKVFDNKIKQLKGEPIHE